jgi:hypothetical protein
MSRWISNNVPKTWLTPLVFSIFIHVIIVVILALNTIEPRKPIQKPMTAIKSYLVVAKPKKIIQPKVTKTEIVQPKVVKTKTDKTVTKVKSKKTSPTVQEKSVIKEKPAQKNIVTKELIKEKSKTGIPEAQVKNLTPAPKSTTSATKRFSGISAARNYLNQQQPVPPTSWQQHQLTNEKSNFQDFQQNQKAKKYDGTFTPEISTMKDLGTSADGSQLIKSGDACYAIKRDQFGDSVWLSTNCPLSTDPLRQAYRASMDKYLKKN